MYVRVAVAAVWCVSIAAVWAVCRAHPDAMYHDGVLCRSCSSPGPHGDAQPLLVRVSVWCGAQGVHLVNCPNVTDNLLSRLLGTAKCKKISHLGLVSCPALTDMVLIGLTNAPTKVFHFPSTRVLVDQVPGVQRSLCSVPRRPCAVTAWLHPRR